MKPFGKRAFVGAGLAVLTVIGSLTVARPPDSLALLSDSAGTESEVSSGSIFSGERTTSAFDVRDASSGSEVDHSSAFAFSADGRIATTSDWVASFASDRYLELDFNAPLPTGLSVSGASFAFRFSSTDAAGVACHYLEVRRISSGEIVATHGSAAVPVACVTGTTFSSSTTAVPSVDSTQLANDLRIRVYGSESGGNGMRVDRATVTGATPHAAFELYPVMLRDAADSTPAEMPWELAGQ